MIFGCSFLYMVWSLQQPGILLWIHCCLSITLNEYMLTQEQEAEMNKASLTSFKDTPAQSLFHFLAWYLISFLKLWVSEPEAWSRPGLDNTMVNPIPKHSPFLCFPEKKLVWHWEHGSVSFQEKLNFRIHLPYASIHPPFLQKGISYNSEKSHRKRKCQVAQAIHSMATSGKEINCETDNISRNTFKW